MLNAESSLVKMVTRIRKMERSDRSLADYVSTADPFVVHALIKAMKSNLSGTSRHLAKSFLEPTDIPEAGSQERQNLAESMVDLLRWYGSNAVAYAARRVFQGDGGCHYRQMLRDVAKALGRKLKRKDRPKIPRVATDEDMEQLIAEQMLGIALRGKKPDEISQMLLEAGLEAEAAAAVAKEYGPGLSGLALPALAKVLGKKTVTALMEQVIIYVAYRKLGKQGAIQLARRIVTKLPQKTWSKMFHAAGWAILAGDLVLFVTSPAKRITIPTVAMVSALRVRERLG